MKPARSFLEERNTPALTILPVENIEQGTVTMSRVEFEQLYALVNSIAARNQGDPLETFASDALRIQVTVAREFDVSIEDMLSQKRTDEVFTARAVAMHLMQSLLHYSQRRIHRLFQRRSEGAVSHSLQSIRTRMELDEVFRSKVRRLEAKLQA